MNNSIKSTFILSITALIWGSAFVAQKAGMEFVGPFFFNGSRSLLGAVTLIIFIFIASKRKQRANGGGETRPGGSKQLLQGGIVCGLVLFCAGNLQQVGLVYVSASKAGFLTTLYIVLVPIFALFLKQKTRWNAWAGVLIAVVGLYFLCLTDSLSIASGDIIVIIGACFWALHILVIDHYTNRVDSVKLSCMQFIVSGALGLVFSIFFDRFFTEPGSLTSGVLLAVLPAILYSGVLSSGVGFTLQAIGQRYAKPAVASIVMSLESVFAVIGGFLILGERLTPREMLGCVLMFAAVILAQLQFPALTKKSMEVKE